MCCAVFSVCLQFASYKHTSRRRGGFNQEVVQNGIEVYVRKDAIRNAANSVHITSHSFHHDSVCIFLCILATAELGGVISRLLGVTGRRSQSRQAERPIRCLSQHAWCVISAGSATDEQIGSPDVDELSAYRAGHPRRENTRSGYRHPEDTTTLLELFCSCLKC